MEGQARLEAVVQAFPEMTFVVDSNGVNLDFVADGLEPHIPPDQLLGKSVTDLLPEEAARQMLECIKLALKTGRDQRLRYELTWDDGTHSEEARFVRLGPDRVAVFVRDHTVEQWLIDDANGRKARPGPAQKAEPRMEWPNPYRLSYREFSVLNLLKGGTTDREIAGELGIASSP